MFLNSLSLNSIHFLNMFLSQTRKFFTLSSIKGVALGQVA